MVIHELPVAYLIDGVFLQDMAALVDADERQIMDKRTVFQPNPKRYPFAGLLFRSKDQDVLIGKLYDVFGESTLTEVVLSADRFAFVKAYWQRAPEVYGIQYEFTMKDGTWHGSYNNAAVGICSAQCRLSEVNPERYTF